MPASQLMTSVAIASPPLRATPSAERISPRPGRGGSPLAGAAGDDDEDAAVEAVLARMRQAVSDDDIQDGATTRRGAASIAGRYGAAAAVCLGDHLLFAALALLAEVPEPALIRQFAGGRTQAVRGQASELDPGLWPAMTPARSLALARAKTGAMAACHAQARDLLAEANALARPTPFAAVIVTITSRIGQKLQAAATARGVAGA